MMFDDSIFRSERFLEGLERVLEAWGEAKWSPRGAKKDRFFVGAPGRPKSEQAWKRRLLEKEVPDK